jgi:flagellar hook-length control protein FliK
MGADFASMLSSRLMLNLAPIESVRADAAMDGAADTPRPLPDEGIADEGDRQVTPPFTEQTPEQTESPLPLAAPPPPLLAPLVFEGSEQSPPAPPAGVTVAAPPPRLETSLALAPAPDAVAETAATQQTAPPPADRLHLTVNVTGATLTAAGAPPGLIAPESAAALSAVAATHDTLGVDANPPTNGNPTNGGEPAAVGLSPGDAGFGDTGPDGDSGHHQGFDKAGTVPPSLATSCAADGGSETLFAPALSAHTGLSGGAAAAASSARGVAPRSTPASASATDQVSVRLTMAARAGLDRIAIALTPDHLGHVEVRLDIGRNGQVNALILAAEPATLDALRGDARGLEQALAAAGLQADDGALQFGLLSGGGDGDRSSFCHPETPAAASTDADDGSDPTPTPRAPERPLTGPHHIDLEA